MGSFSTNRRAQRAIEEECAHSWEEVRMVCFVLFLNMPEEIRFDAYLVWTMESLRQLPGDWNCPYESPAIGNLYGSFTGAQAVLRTDRRWSI